MSDLQLHLLALDETIKAQEKILDAEQTDINTYAQKPNANQRFIDLNQNRVNKRELIIETQLKHIQGINKAFSNEYSRGVKAGEGRERAKHTQVNTGEVLVNPEAARQKSKYLAEKKWPELFSGTITPGASGIKFSCEVRFEQDPKTKKAYRSYPMQHQLDQVYKTYKKYF